MKLYTEEQVRTIYLNGFNDGLRRSVGVLDLIIEQLAPIELPSDEEIRERAENSGGDDSLSPADEYENGAKWMKEMILNKSK